jgi:hypothetical protein
VAQSFGQSDPIVQPARGPHASDDWTNDAVSGLKNFGETVGNDILDAPKSIWQMVSHPIETYQSVTKTGDEYAGQAIKEFSAGNYGHALSKGIGAVVPFVGPVVSDLSDRIEEGDWNGAGDQLGHLAAMEIMAKAAKAVPEIAADPAVQAAAARSARAAKAGLTQAVKNSVELTPTTNWGLRAAGLRQTPTIVNSAAKGASLATPLLGHTIGYSTAGALGATLGALFPALQGLVEGVKEGWANSGFETTPEPAPAAEAASPSAPSPVRATPEPTPTPAVDPELVAKQKEALDAISQQLLGYKSFSAITDPAHKALAIEIASKSFPELATKAVPELATDAPETSPIKPEPVASTGTSPNAAPGPNIPVVTRNLWAGPNGAGADSQVKFISEDGLKQYANDSKIHPAEASQQLQENGYTILSKNDLMRNLKFRAKDMGVDLGDISGLSTDDLLAKYDDLMNNVAGPRSREHTLHIESKFQNQDLGDLLQKSLDSLKKAKGTK